MKKLVLLLAVSLFAVNVFCQNTIKFLGIPIDGTKKEMTDALRAKGYTYNSARDVLTGEFNGTDVYISVQTVNNKVYRLAIMDESFTDEANIKVRFNKLFGQFMSNKKYKLLDGEELTDSDKISYEMTVNKKRYEAAFGFTDDNVNGIVWYMIADIYGKYGIAMFYENLDNAANGDDL